MKIIKGVIDKPARVLVFGQPGVGKTTFACSAPNPIVIQAERGSDQFDVQRFEQAKSWQDIQAQVRWLATEEHDRKTVVIDTLDAAESLLFADICAEPKVNTIEDVGGGYGKGYTRAVEKWRELLADLEHLSTTRGMAVVFTAHSTVKVFANPEGADYEQWIPALNRRSWATLYGWCDAVLFAHYEMANTETDIESKGKAVNTGKRLLRSSKSAAVEAKNRYGLPATIELRAGEGWAHFDSLRNAVPSLKRALEAEIEMAAPELQANVRAWLATAPQDAGVLRAAIQRLQTKRMSNQPQITTEAEGK